jgi:DNA-binding phage protein
MRRSWTQVADELGLTREVVYRALAMLDRQGRISRSATDVCLMTPPE